ncbi:MAG: aminotransferase class I/II-fold pyridoxal phosphate-dependent enzyme [Treponema sp.]|jgi:choline kinase/histidinol-phosphate/aromatic aminotransferase/cobyric acid decarboxylase-like protein|nr:aminotransferase class I/II-fold pyridoxal phosphate-dependent enzyme [Treponema sp.]
MQALILAAGMGTRLSQFTRTVPKCMVPVNGIPMIESSIEALIAAGIKKLVIGLGYKGTVLKDFITQTFPPERLNGMCIEYAENPVYDTTNNIYSLYLAKDFFARDDTILLESDLVYDKNIITELLRCPDKNLAVVSRFEPWMDGTCTLLDKDNHIKALIDKAHFKWKKTDSYYKTVNIYKFSKEFINDCYLPFLESYQTVFGKNEYYETVLKILEFLDHSFLKALKVSGDRWYEIDDPADLNIAENRFADGQKKLSMLNLRNGGVWRFPSLKDFTNTANAFFPPKKLSKEIASSLQTLITQRSSSPQQESLLAAKLLKIQPGYTAVANSPADFFAGPDDAAYHTTAVVQDSVFAKSPLFRTAAVIPAGQNCFGCTPDDILAFLQKSEISTVCLSNPDYATGHFIAKSDMLSLCRKLAEKDIRLVVDETYSVFANSDIRYTLLEDQILSEFPGLTVVKSMALQYGVPGLNLAVLASGNETSVRRINALLPDGIVNSTAEYFMQILEKYKKYYASSFDAAAAERHRLEKLLGAVPGLTPVQGQTNAVTCMLSPAVIKPAELAEKLLENYGILITGSTTEHSYIRIAVRTKTDNDFLLSALKEELNLPEENNGKNDGNI